MSGIFVEVTDQDFEKIVLESESIVLVDFWAPWCAPCKALSPILEKLAKEETFREKITFTKMNTDENPKTPEEYDVNGIPSVKFFKSHKLIAEFVGLRPESYVREFLTKLLEGNK